MTRVLDREALRRLDAEAFFPDPPPMAPTGAEAFDEVLGGGLPRGRVVELFGAPGSGKTALCLGAAAAAPASSVAWITNLDEPITPDVSTEDQDG